MRDGIIRSAKCYPVPRAYSRKIPSRLDAAFGAPRKYKERWGRHTGIDIYAPVGSLVFAIESGTVVHVSDFTGPPTSPQWRKTWYVMVEHADGRVAVYGELRKPKFRKGQRIKSGQTVGCIAKVLYGKTTRHSSMLHFELHKKNSRIATDWYGRRPNHILNPTSYLRSA